MEHCVCVDGCIKYLGQYFFSKIDTFYITRTKQKPKNKYAYHSHDFVEICYVASGNGHHIINNNIYKVYQGNLFILNTDVSHAFYKDEDVNDLITYNIVLKPTFFEYELIDFNDFNDRTLSYLFDEIDVHSIHKSELLKLKADIQLNTQEQDEFGMLIEKIYNEYSTMREGSINIIKAYMIELIVKIMRCLSRKSMNDKTLNKRVETISKIIKYLRENYSIKYSLEEMAVKSFFTKNYLCKLFKDITGQTISEYLQNIRIEEACKLIATTNKKLVDICYEVGFNDYKFFCHVFKKIKGMTPHKYRNSKMLNSIKI